MFVNVVLCLRVFVVVCACLWMFVGECLFLNAGCKVWSELGSTSLNSNQLAYFGVKNFLN